MALIVQPNPMLGSSVLAMLGKTSPPTVLPHAAAANATALLRAKYVDITVMAGVNRKPLPMPVQTPCARNTCQYVVEIDVMKVPTTIKTAPVVTVALKNPASVRMPAKLPAKKSRKTSKEPIQAMSDGGRSNTVM